MRCCRLRSLLTSQDPAGTSILIDAIVRSFFLIVLMRKKLIQAFESLIVVSTEVIG
jgi:hypothetical protein